MHDNLTRGFQLHVHLYSVSYILNHLTGASKQTIGENVSNTLQPGQITSPMIAMISELLLSELFGDLMEEKKVEDAAKKHIRESKA